tara:strand:+ start:686 stop:913 length:228 start_codon:yes stop_codon:yes gene_type:complete
MKVWYEKRREVGKYDLEVSITSMNAIFDFWIEKDSCTIDLDGSKPFYYFRIEILKIKICLMANIFYGWHTHDSKK